MVERGRIIMNDFEDVEIISTYTQGQAIEDGILVKLCSVRWSGVDKPYIATTHIFNDIGYDGAMEIWKEFVDWKINVFPALPEEDQLFYTGMNDKRVWIIEDESAFTLMYPEAY
jgi:hypothetical protein